MKLIVAIIKPFKLEEVKSAAHRIEAYVTEVKGFAARRAHQSTAAANTRDFLPKVKLESPSLTTLREGRRHDRQNRQDGKIGDGKVFVLPLEEVVRIRTDERGESAV